MPKWGATNCYKSLTIRSRYLAYNNLAYRFGMGVTVIGESARLGEGITKKA